MPIQKTLKNSLLWISILPASLAAMFLSFGVWRILHIITSSRYIDQNSWINIIFVEFMSNFLASAAFVYVGYKVAPNKKIIVAIILTSLLLIVSGSSLYILNFITKNYFQNIGTISGIFGAVICCVGIYEEELKKKIV
jgi:hypothetical protein